MVNVEFRKYFKADLVNAKNNSTKEGLIGDALATATAMLENNALFQDSKISKSIYLNTLDNLWRQHLGDLGHIREGIHLRALGQKDPLTEWKKDAYDLFGDFSSAVQVDYIQSLLLVLFDEKR